MLPSGAELADYRDLRLNASSPGSVAVSSYPLQHNVIYGVKVLATNVLGLTGTGTSPGWRHDLTQPISTFIYTYEVDGAVGVASAWDGAPGATTFPDAVRAWNNDSGVPLAEVAATYGRISPWNRTWETDLSDADPDGYLVTRVPRLYFNATSPGTPTVDMLFRFAAYDAESHVGSVLVSLGRAWGGNDVFGARLRWEAATTTVLQPASPPGLYNLRRYKQFFEGIMRFPTAGIPHGTRLYVTARVFNYAGLYAVAQGRSTFVFDATPPVAVPRRVVNGPKAGGLWNEFTNVSSTWRARLWDAFVEYESGIRYLYVGLGSSPGAFDVAPARRMLGWEVEPAWAGLDVPHGTRVYVTAVAQNWAGLNTTLVGPQPVLVDRTAPPVAAVYDGSAAMPATAWAVRSAVPDDEYGNNGDVDFTSVTTGAFANWAGLSWQDAESGIANFFVQFESDARGPLTGGSWVPNGAATTAAWPLTRAAALPHNDTVRARLRSENRAGSASAGFATSNGVRVDTTPVEVWNASLGSPPFVTLQHAALGPMPFPADHAVAFSCLAFEDVSPLVGCAYAVGSCPGCADALRWTPFASLGTRLPARPSPYTLATPQLATNAGGAGAARFTSGAVYWGACHCYSAAGSCGTSVTLPFSVDNDAPFIGAVYDAASNDAAALRTDIDFTRNGTVFVASFPQAGDVVTPVVDCAVALGTNASAPGGDADVAPWRSVGAAARHVVIADVALPRGQRVHAFVRCTDAAGNTGRGASNGLIFDDSAPAGSVLGGAGVSVAGQADGSVLALPHQAFIPDGSSVACRLGVSDAESGLASAQVGLASPAVAAQLNAGGGGGSGGADVVPLASVPLGPLVRIGNLSLPAGTTVHCVARVSNAAGLVATFVGAAMTVDVSPPACAAVVDVDPAAAGYAAGAVLPGWLAGASTPSALTVPVQVSLRTRGAGVLTAVSCADAESGVVAIERGLGSSPAAADVAPLALLLPHPQQHPPHWAMRRS
jgi:hypothetical protein